MLGKVEELKLISQCVLFDDRDAFGMLVEAYQPEIRRFFLSLTMGDRQLSEDLAQETFIKAYTNIRSFKGLSKFGTWLYRIGYNEFYTYKSRQREDAYEDVIQPDEPSYPVETADAAMDVKECMKMLNDIERTVITLFYLEDQPIKKICQITGMPDGTVKSHLARAKAKMAKLLPH